MTYFESFVCEKNVFFSQWNIAITVIPNGVKNLLY